MVQRQGHMGHLSCEGFCLADVTMLRLGFDCSEGVEKSSEAATHVPL